MSNFAIAALVWLALAAHIMVGIAVWRRWTTLPLVPMLNFVMAFGVVIYWVQRWIGAYVKHYKLYATDQLLPLYAILVCLVSALSVAGKLSTTVPNWIVFALQAAVTLAAVVFVMNFKITRLI